MWQFLAFLRVGLVLTIVAMLIGSAINIATDTDWLPATSITLVVIGAVALAFIFVPSGSAGDEGGSWSAFREIRQEGHSTVGGGIAGGRGSIEPGATSWSSQAILNGAIPLLAAIILIAIWLAT